MALGVLLLGMAGDPTLLGATLAGKPSSPCCPRDTEGSKSSCGLDGPGAARPQPGAGPSPQGFPTSLPPPESGAGIGQCTPSSDWRRFLRQQPIGCRCASWGRLWAEGRERCGGRGRLSWRRPGPAPAWPALSGARGAQGLPSRTAPRVNSGSVRKFPSPTILSASLYSMRAC